MAGYQKARRRYRSEALGVIHDAAFELWGAGRVTDGVMRVIETMCLTKPCAPPSRRGAKWTSSIAVVRE